MNAPDRGGNIVHIIHHSNQFTACMLAVAPLSQYLFSTVRHGLVKLPANFGPTPPRILDSASNCLQAVVCLQDCLQNHRTPCEPIPRSLPLNQAASLSALTAWRRKSARRVHFQPTGCSSTPASFLSMRGAWWATCTLLGSRTCTPRRF